MKIKKSHHTNELQVKVSFFLAIRLYVLLLAFLVCFPFLFTMIQGSLFNKPSKNQRFIVSSYNFKVRNTIYKECNK